MSSDLKQYINLIVEQKVREADVIGGKTEWGSEDHIKDLEIRLDYNTRIRNNQPRGSHARATYSDYVNRLKRDLASAKRAAARRGASQVSSNETVEEAKNSSTNNLLRQYMRLVLAENEGSADMSAAGLSTGDISAASGGRGGGGKGSPGELWSTFITPFTDVAKTVKGKGEEVIRKAWTPVNVAIHTILTSIIPGLGHSYKGLFEKEDADIQKIRSKYKDVYARTDKALSSNDAAFFAFLSSPVKSMAGFALTKSPDAVLGTLSYLTGGKSTEIIKGELSKKLPNMSASIDNFLRKMNQGVSENLSFNGEFLMEYINEEDEDKKESPGDDKEIEEALKDLLSDESFMKKILISGGVKSKLEAMNSDAKKIYISTLEEILEQAKKSLSSSASLEDIKELIGDENFKKAEDSLKEVPEEEREEALKATLANSRKAIKNLYMSSLKERIESLKEEGIPEDSQYVIDYKDYIEKIEAL